MSDTENTGADGMLHSSHQFITVWTSMHRGALSAREIKDTSGRLIAFVLHDDEQACAALSAMAAQPEHERQPCGVMDCTQHHWYEDSPCPAPVSVTATGAAATQPANIDNENTLERVLALADEYASIAVKEGLFYAETAYPGTPGGTAARAALEVELRAALAATATQPQALLRQAVLNFADQMEVRPELVDATSNAVAQEFMRLAMSSGMATQSEQLQKWAQQLLDADELPQGDWAMVRKVRDEILSATGTTAALSDTVPVARNLIESAIKGLRRGQILAKCCRTGDHIDGPVAELEKLLQDPDTGN